MEKIWYVKNRWAKNGKVYRSEKEFLSAVRGEKDDREVFIYTLAETGKAGEIKTATISSRERNDQLRCVLGEAGKYEEAISVLRSLHSQLAPESAEKRNVEERMSIIGLDKKEFSRMATGIKNYLLFGVSDSVEWYLALLKCHNFSAMPERYPWYPPRETKSWRMETRQPTEQQRANFAEAKLALKKKKK